LFSTILMTSSAIEVAFIAIAIGLATSLISKKLVNQDRMDELKAKAKKMQDEYKDAIKSGDKARIDKAKAEQKEMMGIYKEITMSGFKPMLITFVPILLVIFFLRSTYGDLGNIVELPFFNWQLSWFWWYFIVVIITGISIEITYKQYRKRKKAKAM